MSIESRVDPKDIVLDDVTLEAFHAALEAMARFHSAFGRPLDVGIVGELHAAKLLSLTISGNATVRGFDAVDANGLRYQIKCRNNTSVDVNNFEFDYLVLVNMNEHYQLTGLWKLSVSDAQKLFVWRGEKYQKWQTFQNKIKAQAERLA